MSGLAVAILLTACGHGATVNGPSRPALVLPHSSGTTNCGGDGRGQCPSLGKSAATEPLAMVVGQNTEVSLAPYFTSDLVTTPQAGLRFGGLGGEAFALSTFPSSGNLPLRVEGADTVTFLIPGYGPGVRSAVLLNKPMTIPLPPGVYGQLWLLEAGHQGNYGPIDARLTYADKTAAAVPLTFGDWCNGSLPMKDAAPESVGIVVPYILGPADASWVSDETAPGLPPSGAVNGHPTDAAQGAPLYPITAACGLWAERVDIPPSGKPIVSLSLPGLPADPATGAYVMALTLKTVVGVTGG